MDPLDMLGILAQGVGATVTITALALVVGAVLGLPLALARRSPAVALRTLATVWVQVVRGVPPLVWLLIAFLGVGQMVRGLSAMNASIIVFAAVASVFFCEIYVGGFSGVPRGQFEAASALALPRSVALVRVVVPQAMRISVPAMASYGIGMLKDSALVSVIGVQDITFYAGSLQAKTGDGLWPFLEAGLLYVALSLPLAIAGRLVAARLDHATSGGAR